MPKIAKRLSDLQRVEDHPFIDTDNTGVKEARERGRGVAVHHAFIQDRVAADIFSRFVEMEERPVVRGAGPDSEMAGLSSPSPIN